MQCSYISIPTTKNNEKKMLLRAKRKEKHMHKKWILDKCVVIMLGVYLIL
uniref:Uncharacterized protein n=1 Tax=Ciona intestinalis TaxID=7719 RepID=H2XXU1_CIOIN